MVQLDLDDESVDPGAIQFNGTSYEMIYNGSHNGFYQGGYATSADGISWTKDNVNNPILPAGSPTSWDYPYAHTGAVVYNYSTNLYYLFYAGGNFPLFKIGLAASPNFAGPWTKDSIPVIDVGPAGAWDDITVTWPFVIYNSADNEYKMWYTGGLGLTGKIETGYASSPVITGI